MSIYKKIKQFLLQAFFVFLALVCKAQKINKCDLLNAMLSIERINNDLRISESATKPIRIIDKSRSFKKITCQYKSSIIGVLKETPLDLNTGKCIDLVITKMSKYKDIVNMNVFYATSGQKDKFPILYDCIIVFKLNPTGIEVKEIKISNIQ